MSILAIDISHYQGNPDFAKVKAAGIGLVFLKVSENVNYTDPTFRTNRDHARAAGLTVGFYHFARATNAIAEADYFCNAVGSLQRGDIVALDWEVSSGDPVSWSLAWLQHVEQRLGVKPLIYLNQSTVSGFNWDKVVAGNYGLWLAKYDGSQTAPAVAHWPLVAVKQYSDAGTVAGVAGKVDLDVFEGDSNALAKYGYQGGSAPAPAPSPTPAPASNRVQIGTVTVKSGDNLTDIAHRFPQADVTAASIAADNGLSDPSKIYPGQVLRVLSSQGAPAPAPAPAPATNNLPEMAFGQTSDNVKKLQAFLNKYNWRPVLPILPLTGYFGPSTAAVLHQAGRQLGVQGDADGKNFGPKFREAFWRIGFRI